MISARHCFNFHGLKTTADIFWIICCTYNEIQGKTEFKYLNIGFITMPRKGKIYDVK